MLDLLCNVMRRVFWAPLFMLVWVAVTIFALLSGIQYSWPDNVHVDYGMPFIWATNTLSTIAGPANLWDVNLTSLLFDLMLWLGIMVIAIALILWKSKK